MQLSSSLKNITLTFHFGPAGRTAVRLGDFTLSSWHPNGSTGEGREAPAFETPLHYNDIGDLINETQIVNNGKKSAGLSVEGDHPEKDGITPSRLQAKAVKARGARLTGGSRTRSAESIVHFLPKSESAEKPGGAS